MINTFLLFTDPPKGFLDLLEFGEEGTNIDQEPMDTGDGEPSTSGAAAKSPEEPMEDSTPATENSTTSEVENSKTEDDASKPDDAADGKGAEANKSESDDKSSKATDDKSSKGKDTSKKDTKSDAAKKGKKSDTPQEYTPQASVRIPPRKTLQEPITITPCKNIRYVWLNPLGSSIMISFWTTEDREEYRNVWIKTDSFEVMETFELYNALRKLIYVDDGEDMSRIWAFYPFSASYAGVKMFEGEYGD